VDPPTAPPEGTRGRYRVAGDPLSAATDGGPVRIGDSPADRFRQTAALLSGSEERAELFKEQTLLCGSATPCERNSFALQRALLTARPCVVPPVELVAGRAVGAHYTVRVHAIGTSRDVPAERRARRVGSRSTSSGDGTEHVYELPKGLQEARALVVSTADQVSPGINFSQCGVSVRSGRLRHIHRVGR
jgi:hypothetical protein